MITFLNFHSFVEFDSYSRAIIAILSREQASPSFIKLIITYASWNTVEKPEEKIRHFFRRA